MERIEDESLGGKDDEIEDDVDSGWGGLEEESPPTRSVDSLAMLAQARAMLAAKESAPGSRAQTVRGPQMPTIAPSGDDEPEPATRRADDEELARVRDLAVPSQVSGGRVTPRGTPAVRPSAARVGNRGWSAPSEPPDQRVHVRPTPPARPAVVTPAPPAPTPAAPSGGASAALRLSGGPGQAARKLAERKATRMNLSVEAIAAELRRQSSNPPDASGGGEEAPRSPTRELELPVADVLAAASIDATEPSSPRTAGLRARRAEKKTLAEIPVPAMLLKPIPASLSLDDPSLDDLSLDDLDDPRPAMAPPPPSAPESAPKLGLTRSPSPTAGGGGLALRAPGASGLARPPAPKPSVAPPEEPRKAPARSASLPPLTPLRPSVPAPRTAATRPLPPAVRAAVPQPAQPAPSPAPPAVASTPLDLGSLDLDVPGASPPQAASPQPASPRSAPLESAPPPSFAPPPAKLGGGAGAPRVGIHSSPTQPNMRRVLPDEARPSERPPGADDRATPLPNVPGPRDSFVGHEPELAALEVGEARLSADEAHALASLANDLSLDEPLADEPPRRASVESLSVGDEAELAPIVQRFEKGDYMGALIRVEALLERRPGFAAAERYADSCREILHQMYLSKLGEGTDVLRIALPADAISALALDSRAAFLISLVDGIASIDEILDMSGMPALDALRMLYELKEQGVVAIDSMSFGR